MKNKSSFKKIGKTSPLAIILVLFFAATIAVTSFTTVLLCLSVSGTLSFNSASESTNSQPQNVPTDSSNQSIQQESFSQTPQTNNSVSADNTSPQQNNSENKTENATDEKKPTSSAPSGTKEIVEYFNSCANKVKTDATTVVKNFENREVGELVVPAILQSTADTLISSLISDDTDPITYSTKDEIKANFIVPEQEYVSKLTADDVVEATCTDKGDTYEIHILLKDEKNPSAGKGVGAVCDVIEAHEVSEKAPDFVTELSTNYHNCQVTATIDKENGRMIHAVYSTPVTLSVTVDLLGTHNISAEFTYIKDFSITY